MNSRTVYFLEVTGLFQYSSVLAFQNNDKEAYRSVQMETKEEILKEKEQHKKKAWIVISHNYNSVKRVWSGMKLMSIYIYMQTVTHRKLPQ